ncbi:hypothetical protein K501DRAFT_289031 [Backusella circina FSU 941]|nr:hypothetical protein K501DRAFT_289031 [Backusella circina FSU 941]
MPEETVTEPRKKRAKIMSACSECRRKKTKCNGEQPCRNCQKSSVQCVYPAATQADDRRNGGPSKAALEAIEDRLKTIEDMLKTILQSQVPVPDLDPVAVNNFLNRGNKNNSPQQKPMSTSPPTRHQNHLVHNQQHHHYQYYQQHYSQHHPPPSSSTAAPSPLTTTTPSSSHHVPPAPAPPSSSSSASAPGSGSGSPPRLPSIHNLSAPPTAQSSYHVTMADKSQDLPGLGEYQLFKEESSLQPMKKRKR